MNMREVCITGVGTTPFGPSERSLRELTATAVGAALADARLTAEEVGLVVYGNCLAGSLEDQEMVRGQMLTTDTGLAGRPLLNVENACATSSSAVHAALTAIRSNEYDTVLVCGAEKMTAADKRAVLDALMGAVDVERRDAIAEDLTGRPGATESFFMEVYARQARDYMGRTGATANDFARVAVKNSAHGRLNPNAQYQRALTLEEVLGSRIVADPLTVLMCSPVADGAAALVLRAEDVTADEPRPVRIRASAIGSGIPGGAPMPLEERVIRAAYDQAGLGSEDLDVIELHDAAAPNELLLYEELGLCDEGEGAALLASGATALGGRVPVNPSGGLVSRGHPIAATGAAQLVELVTQLRGRAGERQVPGARIALAENAGGYTHPEGAACAVTILEAIAA
jgi:acetyl-CoA acetyltransferase